MARLTLSCFGPYQVSSDGMLLTHFHSVKVQALLAYLALEADRPHSRESLAALLWSFDSESSSRSSLRQTLYELRKLLGDREDHDAPSLLVTRQTVQFNRASSHTLDVADFLSSIRDGKLEQAAALYRGELLAGLSCESEPFEEWLRQSRQRFHNLAVDVCFKLTDQALHQGNLAQARTYAERQLTLEPWREEAHRQLMTALALSGERSAALAQYETCRRVLADELAVEPDAETVALYEQIKAGKLRGPRTDPLPTSPRAGQAELAHPPPRHNLPPQPTPFIGRQTDLAQIAARLADPACRLLTVVGPGGMGKTRLALQAAQAILDFRFGILEAATTPDDPPKSEIQNPKFEGGVFFVALAGVASPDLLVSTIAAALDFTFYDSADPKSQLLDYLRPKSMLLVLDNFEHLLDGADLVADLLAAAPGIKIVATSREALSLQEEWLHPLTGMSFPNDTPGASALDHSALAQFTAVQLFVQRAGQVKPAFDLDAEGDAVVRICRLVEGMPLGIELAATWLKFYSCEQIADEVVRNLDFLTTTLRNILPRHRSIRAVFAHSWSLLSAAEQQVLQRLAVFRGGFRLEAAQQVTGASLPLLVSLAEKSLIQIGSGNRFQIHELLRQFAEEQLQSDPLEYEQVQMRHSFYYTSFLAQQEARITGAEHLAAKEEIEQELENVWVAWNLALKRADLPAIERSLECLFLFHYVNCWYDQGRQLFKRSAEFLMNHEPSEHLQLCVAKLTTKQLLLELIYGIEANQSLRYAEIKIILEQYRTRWQPYGATAVMGDIYWALARMARGHDRNLAYDLGRSALSIYEASNNHFGMARILEMLSLEAHGLGDYAEAMRWARQGIAICEQQHCRMILGEILNIQGEIYRALGKYAEGIRVVQMALAVRTAIKNRRGIGWSLNSLGKLEWLTGEYALAQMHVQQSLVIFEQIGLGQAQRAALNTLGDMACSLGDYSQARNYFRSALEPPLLAGTLTHSWTTTEALAGLADLLCHEGRTAQAAVLLIHIIRTTTAWQETKERATTLLAQLSTVLSADEMAAAQAQAERQDLAIVVGKILAEPQIAD